MAKRLNPSPANSSKRLSSGAGSSSTKRLNPSTSRRSRSSKDDGFSLGGLAGNFFRGARDTVFGLGPGLWETGKALNDITSYAATFGKDPIDERTKRLGRGIIDSYKETYGRGWRGLYENPFGVVLDALAVASVGAGTAVRAGAVPARATLTTGAGKTVVKEFSRRPLRRVSQATMNKALNALPENTKAVGEVARAGRILQKQSARDSAAARKILMRQEAALGKLHSDSDQVAASARAMFGDDFEAYKFYRDQDTPLGSVLKDPKVEAKFLAPSERVKSAAVAMRDIGDSGAALLRIPDDVAEARRWLMVRLAHGAKFEDDLSRYAKIGDGSIVEFLLKENGDFARTKAGKLKARKIQGAGRAGQYEATASGKSHKILRLAEDELTPLATIDDLPRSFHGKVGKTLVGGPSLDDLRKIPKESQPAYFPHTMQSGKPKWGFGGRAGGTGAQKNLGELKQNLGKLAGEGKLVTDPKITIASFARAVKHDLYTTRHRQLLEHGNRMGLDEASDFLLKHGDDYQVVRTTVGERVPYQVKAAGEFGDWLDEIGHLDKWLDDVGASKIAEKLGDLADDAPNGKIPAAAIDKATNTVVVVPRELVRQVTGEFTQASKFAYWMNKNPVRVWRAMVLNLRPAWLVNNIIGNTLMYLVDDASPASLRALAESFKRIDPGQAAKIDELLVTKFDDVLVKKFADMQTFIGSQRPTGLMVGRVGRSVPGRVARRSVGALADVDRAYEQILRNAKIKSIIRKHPELKKRVAGMQKETAEYWKWVDSELTMKPHLVDQITKQVNEALGDFMSMSRFERNVARTVFPFYAWFRAITGVTLKMPLNHPLKSVILGRLGEVGAEIALEDLGLTDGVYPGFAAGMIKIGDFSDGRLPVIVSGPANPYGTVADIGESVAALFSPNMGDAGRQLPGASPFVVAPLQALFGKNLATGSPLHKNWENRFGVFGNVPGQVVRNLPQWRVGEGLLGARYQGTKKRPTLYDQNLEQLLMRYFGYPRADVSTKRLKDIP